jgi:3-deoxy-7-phosphoheptulonate synthase
VEELERVEFFTSHEGLNLLYESAQTRRVPRREGWYDLTTHLPWIGERTGSLDGAHVEFFRGIANPVGIKLGPRVDEPGGHDTLVRLLDVLNPGNEAGKIVLIARMGVGNVRRVLPRAVERVRREGRVVLWVCDPMHGNTMTAGGESSKFTVQSSNGAPASPVTGHRSPVTASLKTRSFADIVGEVEAAWEVCESMGSRLGGVHIEVTGEDVTECVGGVSGVTEADLPRRYESACDPRLNYEQAMELAMAVGRRMARIGR